MPLITIINVDVCIIIVCESDILNGMPEDMKASNRTFFFIHIKETGKVDDRYKKMTVTK